MPLVQIICHFNISNQRQVQSQGKRPFKFENIWVQDEEYGRVVVERWNERMVRSILEFADAVAKCGDDLRSWSRVTYGNIQDKLMRQQKELLKLQSNVRRIEDNVVVDGSKKRLKKLEKKELYWRQR